MGSSSAMAIPSTQKLVPRPHALIPGCRTVNYMYSSLVPRRLYRWSASGKRNKVCCLSPNVSTTSDCVRTVVVCEELYGVFWTGVGAYTPILSM